MTLLEEELFEIIRSKSEKVTNYEISNLNEMWLLVVSGSQISQAMGIPHPDILNDFSDCNELINQSGFNKIYLYQYMRDRILEWSGYWKVKNLKRGIYNE